MRLCLVGADLEENLGIGAIAQAAEEAGHRVQVMPFNDGSAIQRLAANIFAARPDVVGLSMQFQHRAHEFVSLARALRAAGYRGHVTAGGQLPTLAWKELLGSPCGIDSLVLHEGERTIVELLAALGAGRPLDDVAGLAIRCADGAPRRTAARPLEADLDALPVPRRYRPHARHLGVPFIPILGSRGCWGRCTYCSITSFYRDARAHGGGALLRQRSPEHVAAEMALLADACGGTGIFCFHDDNFLLPRPADTLARLTALRSTLDEYGVGKVAMVGKARPDCLTADLARHLFDLGVIRLYVGVENASERGAAHLGRSRQGRSVDQALAACREAGIFACYNLLIFEPQTTLDDVAANIAFIRAHATHPVNFCRAEPYYGTPLHGALAAAGELAGSWLGFDYRLADPRAELLFRICAAAFRERNFAESGVANRAMGLGYSVAVLERFTEVAAGPTPALRRRAETLTRSIALETAAFLEEALGLAARVDLADRDCVEREAALLGLRIAAADRRRHAEIDDLTLDLAAFAARARTPRAKVTPTRKLREVAQRLALGSSLALWATGCRGCGPLVADPVPGPDASVDSMVVDPAPPDASADSFVSDPLPPPDAAVDADVPVVDPPPPDFGVDAGIDAGPDADVPVVDPPPPDFGIDAGKMSLAPVDQWQDTTPRRARRSIDLPLFEPPAPSLVVVGSDGEWVTVRLADAGPASIRWQCEGALLGDGAEVRWHPASPEDQLDAAVRTRGGVAVVSLRARSTGPLVA